MVWFGLVFLYGILTIVSYLILNHIPTYVLDIKDFVLFGLAWFVLDWIGLDLWHINHCKLFNATPCLYICIKYIGLGLVLLSLWHIHQWKLFNAKSYSYICILLPSGKRCLIAPGEVVLIWTIETVLSPLVGGWWGQGITRAFTRCMMKIWKKERYIRFGLVWFGSMAYQPL